MQESYLGECSVSLRQACVGIDHKDSGLANQCSCPRNRRTPISVHRSTLACPAGVGIKWPQVRHSCSATRPTLIRLPASEPESTTGYVVIFLTRFVSPQAWQLTGLLDFLGMSTPALHVDQATVGNRALVSLKFHGIHSSGLRASSRACSCSAVR